MIFMGAERGVPSRGRRVAVVMAVVVAGAALLLSRLPASRADEPAAPASADKDALPQPLEFMRVHVPAGRLSDVPLGGGRYVPMSVREFEDGLVRLSAREPDAADHVLDPAVSPLATASRYAVALADDGSLTGTVSFDVGWFTGGKSGGAFTGSSVPVVGLSREMPLGTLGVRAGTMQTAAGMGAAVVYGHTNGGMAVATPEAGTYTCDFRHVAEPGTGDAPRFVLPLVPALSSSITLRLPRGIRPVFIGTVGSWEQVTAADMQPPTENSPEEEETLAWRLDVGPRESVEITLAAHSSAAPRLSLWTNIGIHGRQSLLSVIVQPMTPWPPGQLRLEKDAEVLVTQVAVVAVGSRDVVSEASWTLLEDGRTLAIDLPAACIGSLASLAVSAVAPVPGPVGPLPMIHAAATDWAGGGIAIHVAPSLSVLSVEPIHCLVVPPEAATHWPLSGDRGVAQVFGVEHDAALSPLSTAERDAGATIASARPDDMSAPGVWPARLFLEEQAPRAAVRLSLVPRTASLNVARVTTVDLSPGVVVGRAVCDIRVQRGEAFDLTARITPGWFIDAVESITLPTVADISDASRRRDVADPISGPEPAASIDWKVQRDVRGDVLQIGLTVAATPIRGLGLRITGHRAGVALGADFSTAEIDMVRCDGETERSAIVELRTSPETTVEFAGPEQPAVSPDSRLAMLVEEGAVRARVWAGFRATSWMARFVRRRPPLDARTQVRLTVRDDRLTESFTFECHPAASDLDSIVVQFSEPGDDLLDWSLMPPAVGAVTARRLESSDRRTTSAGAVGVGGDRWLVELNPAARGAVTIRAARTIPFTRATPVPLAWVDGATSAVGHVIIRDVGRARPQVINRRLDELPPDPAAAVLGTASLAEFSFDLEAASSGSETAAAELLPGGGEARAWAWREITSSWCYTSGATEYETFFEIENHGRTALSLRIPAGRRVQGILLDGVRVPLGELSTAGGEVLVDLPAGRRLVTLLVRTVAERNLPAEWLAADFTPAWRIDPGSATIDAPVLQREWRLLLPPDLEIAWVGAAVRMVGSSAEASRDWAARLLAATVRPFTPSQRRTRFFPDTPPAEAASVEEAGSSAMAPVFRENAAEGSLLQGFRGFLLVPAGTAGDDGGVVVIHGRVLAAVALLASLVVACATVLVARVRARAALLICLLAGVAALWVAPPFDGIFRAVWWSAVTTASVVCATRLRNGWQRRPVGQVPVAAVLLVAALAVSPIASAQEAGSLASPATALGSKVERASGSPLQVFITPLDGGHAAGPAGGTALVPEELFRMLARGEGGRTAAARVLAVRVVAPLAGGDGGWASWRLAIDIDADAGGMLVLGQVGSSGRLRHASLRVDGTAARAARPDADGGPQAITFPESGRHSVEVEVEPVIHRRGDVETATISLPVSPATALELVPSAGVDASGIVCEQAPATGVFVAVPRPPADRDRIVFDVSCSMQVRLVRSVAAGIGLATLPKTAASRNDIFWNLDECRLTAVFELEAADAIVRSFVVRADPGLQWIAPSGQSEAGLEQSEAPGAAADRVFIRPLSDGRFLVERRSPDRGRVRFEISFRMPLADPVGIFDVPGAWLEQVGMDQRTVRFVASPSLAVLIDLPAGLAPAAIPEVDASFETRSWSGTVASPIAGAGVNRASPAPGLPAGFASRPVRARLTAERRRQQMRGTQRQAIVFAGEQVRLHLDARLDAMSMALVTIPLEVPAACVIERIELFEDDALHPETAGRGAIDIRWSRTEESGVMVSVQRPRAGRFRLEVDARLPGRPEARGPVPCLRATLAEGTRTLVKLQAEDGLQVRVVGREPAFAESGDDQPGATRLELVSGDPLPEYVLEPATAETTDEVDQTQPASGVTEPAGAPAGEGRVELADIRLAVDERGRTWGLACFELVAEEQVVRVRLPQSWRLFDVVVDGRPVDSVVPASSQSDTIWEARLLDAGWPRSVVVVFAGDLGRRLLDGEPLELAPPAIVGLPCRRVIWTMQVPAGIVLRVAEPARLATATDLQQERREAQQRLAGDFQKALERAVGLEQERLRGFLRVRGDGAMPAADEAWARTLTSLAALRPSTLPVSIVTPEETADVPVGRLTIRAVRQRDPSVPGRAIATLSLLACGGLAWTVARRGVPHLMAAGAWAGVVVPVIAGLTCLLGIVWIVQLVPTWPGGILMAVGLWMVLKIWLDRGVAGGVPLRRAVSPAAAAMDIALATTRYRAPPSLDEGSTTHVAPDNASA